MSLIKMLEELFPDNDIMHLIVMGLYPENEPVTQERILKYAWDSLIVKPLDKEDTDVVIEDSIIKCHGCGKNSVVWELKQLRSADEGMSAVCKCTNPSCRKSWVM